MVLILARGDMIEESKSKNSDYPWHVEVLDKANCWAGLVKGYNCLFTISDYWSYGIFTPQDRCELPGKLFRAKASDERDSQNVFVTSSEPANMELDNPEEMEFLLLPFVNQGAVRGPYRISMDYERL